MPLASAPRSCREITELRRRNRSTLFPRCRIRRASSVSLVLLAVTALVNAAGQANVSVSPNRKEHQPFTAKYLLTFLDEQGAAINFSGTFYRSAGGLFSRIEETEGPTGVRGTDRNIANIADQSWTQASSHTQTSTVTVYLNDRRFQGMVNDVFGNCAILEDESYKRVGESQFLGVRVIEMESKMGKAIVLRDSIAPDLGCFVLRHLLVEHGEVRTIQQVTQVTLGEPDPAAFRVPANYTEVSPLEFEARWQQRFGQDYYGAAQAKRLEQEYQQGRARQRQRQQNNQ